MKLNYKRTFYVGSAFFLILLFWQTYDAIIPKMLIDKFGMSHFWSGAIMAIDNVLALFLLPLFGSISDRHKGKRGKRTPFIVVGTIIAAISFMGLSVVDSVQLSKLDDIVAVTDSESEGYEAAMEALYDSGVEITIEGKKAPISEHIDKQEFTSIENDTDEYTKYVVSARQAYAAKVTDHNKLTLLIFVVILLITLISMAIFRSPAVALMPDVTPKPLRSKANAVINLMGSAGGVLVLVLGILFGTGNTKNDLMNYIPVFALTSCIMLVSLAFFVWKVNEPKFVSEMEEQSRELAIVEDDAEKVENSKKLSKSEVRSLFFILASVVFWFMGYNAITSKYSVYASSVLRMDFNLTLIIAQATAIIAFIPVGMLASKIGRKKSILIGILCLGASFAMAAFVKAGTSVWIVNSLFVLAGLGWATINVNSYPMVVEMSRGSNIGKYTGYYYTASMAAQTITPIISGKIFDAIGMGAMFPYGAIFVFLSFVTMLFVKHGDSIPDKSSPSIEDIEI